MCKNEENEYLAEALMNQALDEALEYGPKAYASTIFQDAARLVQSLPDAIARMPLERQQCLTSVMSVNRFLYRHLQRHHVLPDVPESFWRTQLQSFQAEPDFVEPVRMALATPHSHSKKVATPSHKEERKEERVTKTTQSKDGGDPCCLVSVCLAFLSCLCG